MPTPTLARRQRERIEKGQRNGTEKRSLADGRSRARPRLVARPRRRHSSGCRARVCGRTVARSDGRIRGGVAARHECERRRRVREGPGGRRGFLLGPAERGRAAGCARRRAAGRLPGARRRRCRPFGPDRPKPRVRPGHRGRTAGARSAQGRRRRGRAGRPCVPHPGRWRIRRARGMARRVSCGRRGRALPGDERRGRLRRHRHRRSRHRLHRRRRVRVRRAGRKRGDLPLASGLRGNGGRRGALGLLVARKRVREPAEPEVRFVRRHAVLEGSERASVRARRQARHGAHPRRNVLGAGLGVFERFGPVGRARGRGQRRLLRARGRALQQGWREPSVLPGRRGQCGRAARRDGVYRRRSLRASGGPRIHRGTGVCARHPRDRLRGGGEAGRAGGASRRRGLRRTQGRVGGHGLPELRRTGGAGRCGGADRSRRPARLGLRLHAAGRLHALRRVGGRGRSRGGSGHTRRREAERRGVPRVGHRGGRLPGPPVAVVGADPRADHGDRRRRLRRLHRPGVRRACGRRVGHWRRRVLGHGRAERRDPGQRQLRGLARFRRLPQPLPDHHVLECPVRGRRRDERMRGRLRLRPLQRNWRIPLVRRHRCQRKQHPAVRRLLFERSPRHRSGRNSRPVRGRCARCARRLRADVLVCRQTVVSRSSRDRYGQDGGCVRGDGVAHDGRYRADPRIAFAGGVATKDC